MVTHVRRKRWQMNEIYKMKTVVWKGNCTSWGKRSNRHTEIKDQYKTEAQYWVRKIAKVTDQKRIVA